jgi:putative peptide zinc metalloprotease protein
MTQDFENSVRDFGSTRLALREDLIVTPQPSQLDPHYIIEDPVNLKFYRLGHVEYMLVSLFDGRNTVQQALTQLSTAMPNHRLNEMTAAGLCQWLVEMGLANTVEENQTVVSGNRKSSDRKSALDKYNPAVFKLPLFSPNELFAKFNRYAGWIFTPVASLVWVGLIAFASYKVWSDWGRFERASDGIFAPSNWVWLALCWVVLKIIHEISHGIVCKRHGGDVHETGILFVLFAPMPYVDVTSSWRFRSRWERIHVASAGLYAELGLAACAALVWSSTSDPWLANFCFNLIFTATVSTVLFNANPLMRFDGYFILSDLLKLPNLSTSGQLFVRYLAKRYILGVTSNLPNWSKQNRRVFAAYGFLACIWRIVMSVSLVIVASAMFQGAGVVIALFAAFLWFAMPIYKFVQYLFSGKSTDQPKVMPFLIKTSAALALALVIVFYVAWPGKFYAPAVVEYAPDVVIRSSSAGFVDSIHVESGQRVKKGDLLVELTNREIFNEMRDLELQIQQSEIRCRQLQKKGELAQQQSEEENRLGLMKQLRQKRNQVQELKVYAPCDGFVVRRNLSTLLGSYVLEGDLILAIGDESQKQVRLSIAQEDIDAFQDQYDRSVVVDIPSLPLVRSSITKVIPRADTSVFHESLATVNGGRLAVKPVGSDDGSNSAELELLAPRFTAIVALTPDESKKVYAGQRALVSYRPFHKSIAAHVSESAQRWFQQKVESAN